MIKLTLLLLLIAVAPICFGQETDSTKYIQNEDYLQKSRTQKTLGYVFMSGSIIVLTGTFISVIKNTAADLLTTQRKSHSYAVPVTIGLSSFIASLAFFNSASKNKQLAKDVSLHLKLEDCFVIKHKSISEERYPTIAVKIKLGK